MTRSLSAALTALLALATSACGGGGSTRTDACRRAPITVGAVDPGLAPALQLAALPDVVSVDEPAVQNPVPGTRFFVVTFDQPVDHCQPDGARFQQTATVLWRGRDAPTVLATTGYGIARTPRQAEPTALLGANQVLLEHRYFDPSAPLPLAWEHLDIRQAADDQHRVAVQLRALLPARWISTGASKGGMTAVFHRRFYPSDVDGTVAYVAPLSFDRSDARYVPYLDGIGDAACRAGLHRVQRELLQARAGVEALLAAEPDASYERLGLSRAFEFAVLELPWAFWQYGSAAGCAALPPEGATADELYAFLQDVLGGVAGWYGDAALDFYAPYYYQSATQLGGPAYRQDHLADLLEAPIQDVPQDYPPLGVDKPWDGGAAMHDVDGWVRTRGARLLFVYGERDPWSGGQFTPAAGQDAYVMVAPGANHGANIGRLGTADRAVAEARLRAWAGVAASAAALRAEGAAGPVDETVLLPRWPGR